MSNAYGAGSPAAGLNAPGGMPPWLMNLWNYVNPMSQATAGGVDAQGRPQDAITAAQQALAAQALNGGPQASGPIANSQAGNVSTAPITRAPLPIASGGGSAGGGGASRGWDTGINAALHPAAAPIVPQPIVPPAVAAYAGAGQGPFAGRPPAPTAWPDTSTPTGMPAPKPTGTPSATPRPAPHARQQARVAAAAPQTPWITDLNDRQNLPAGNGPLGKNAQTKMGMLDLSKLFSRTG